MIFFPSDPWVDHPSFLRMLASLILGAIHSSQEMCPQVRGQKLASEKPCTKGCRASKNVYLYYFYNSYYFLKILLYGVILNLYIWTIPKKKKNQFSCKWRALGRFEEKPFCFLLVQNLVFQSLSLAWDYLGKAITVIRAGGSRWSEEQMGNQVKISFCWAGFFKSFVELE